MFYSISLLYSLSLILLWLEFLSCSYNESIFFTYSLLSFYFCLYFQYFENFILSSWFHSRFSLDLSFIAGETNECETISIHCLASRLPGANQCCIILAYDRRDISVSTPAAAAAATTKDAYGCPLFVSRFHLFSFLLSCWRYCYSISLTQVKSPELLIRMVKDVQKWLKVLFMLKNLPISFLYWKTLIRTRKTFLIDNYTQGFFFQLLLST